MNKFNLKQISLSCGLMGAIIFISWYFHVLIFENGEIHRQLLLEELHYFTNATWPLNIFEIFYGIVIFTIFGGLFGLIFGYIFNILDLKNKD